MSWSDCFLSQSKYFDQLSFEKLMFRMLWNTIKDGLCYLRNVSVSMKVFLVNLHEATDFTWSEQAYRSSNLLRMLNFFYENYWSRLTSSSKCRGSVTHGDIKCWFSGNANTSRYCLLLSFHLSYQIRCIMNFKKIAITSFKKLNLNLPSMRISWFCYS